MSEINTAVVLAFMGAFVLSSLLTTVVVLLLGRDRPKKVRRLPVVNECGSCEHWDLQAGQDAMLQHPAFAQASGHLSPHAMTRNVDHDDAGAVLPPISKIDASWGQLGACHKAGEGVFMHMTECPVKAYTRASTEILDRRQRRLDEAARLAS